MQSKDNRISIVVLLGATAVGKTDLSIELAEHNNGEIISMDSRLIYQGMDVGTAKPTEQQQTRATHHMIDVATVEDDWNLARYIRAVKESIKDIHSRNHLPILVGGSGQYIRAITEGWQIPEIKPDTRMRIILEDWAEEIGVENLHKRLKYLDPSAADKIDKRNKRRIIRALEVIFSTGIRFSNLSRSRRPEYRILQIGLMRPRQEIYERIDQRIDAMIENGFVEEVKSLMEKGYDLELPSFSAIGYRQLISYHLGLISLDEAKVEIKRLSRQFVRSQANWFKQDDPEINWINVGADTLEQMDLLITDFVAEED